MEGTPLSLGKSRCGIWRRLAPVLLCAPLVLLLAAFLVRPLGHLFGQSLVAAGMSGSEPSLHNYLEIAVVRRYRQALFWSLD